MCQSCNGTGRIVEIQRTVFGQMQSTRTCPDCMGTGQVVEHPCETCQGQGRTPSRETVEVEIPAGVYTGQTITVSDRGEAGLRGDAGGDLVVSVEVLQHERFERHGDDLITSIEIDALQAIVGCTVKVDGILKDEIVDVEVPPACQYAQQVLVNGHGMPRQGKALRGNLVVMVGIRTPDDLDEAALAQIQALVDTRATMGDNE